ncbi:MAG: PIN domain-containing protein, partial [Dongiaceae bacterium]
FAPRDLPPAVGLLDYFPTLPIDAPVADLAAQLRREHGWRLPDAFQAALARYHALQLATRNTRDFPPTRHPWVVVPYEL